MLSKESGHRQEVDHSAHETWGGGMRETEAGDEPPGNLPRWWAQPPFWLWGQLCGPRQTPTVSLHSLGPRSFWGPGACLHQDCTPDYLRARALGLLWGSILGERTFSCSSQVRWNSKISNSCIFSLGSALHCWDPGLGWEPDIKSHPRENPENKISKQGKNGVLVRKQASDSVCRSHKVLLQIQTCTRQKVL